MASLNGDAHGESVLREAKGIPDDHTPGNCYLLINAVIQRPKSTPAGTVRKIYETGQQI